jgi:hypothetical protein
MMEDLSGEEEEDPHASTFDRCVQVEDVFEEEVDAGREG